MRSWCYDELSCTRPPPIKIASLCRVRKIPTVSLRTNRVLLIFMACREGYIRWLSLEFVPQGQRNLHVC